MLAQFAEALARPITDLARLPQTGQHTGQDSGGVPGYGQSTQGDTRLSPLNDLNGFCALDCYGLVRVGGEDAVGFLQGQLTCNVNALLPGGSCHGAQCTPKGRVIANFRVLRGERDFYLLLAADLAALVRKRLQMYVLRSKVVLEDLSPGRRMIGMFGAGPKAGLDASGLRVPDQPGAALEQPDCLALRLGEGSGRSLLIAGAEYAQGLLANLDGVSPRLDPALWRLAGIEAGVPEVTAAVSEEFLPQMLNLDALGGIGFQKGCYTGQEIVTRTHYLGQLKRRMFRLRCVAGAEPRPGTPLYDANDVGLNQVGQVVVAAPDGAVGPDAYQLLAVLALGHVPGGDLRLSRPDGAKAEWMALPYTWTDGTVAEGNQ